MHQPWLSFINFEQDCESGNGKRRRREVQEVSGNATVSSPAIFVGKQSAGVSLGQDIPTVYYNDNLCKDTNDKENNITLKIQHLYKYLIK